jgi:hypothetical protein
MSKNGMKISPDCPFKRTISLDLICLKKVLLERPRQGEETLELKKFNFLFIFIGLLNFFCGTHYTLTN